MFPRFALHLSYRAAMAGVLGVAGLIAPSHPRLAMYSLSTGVWLIALTYGSAIALWIATGRGVGARVLSIEAGAPRGPLRMPLAIELAARHVDSDIRRVHLAPP
jgi:hypothetical protein